MINTIVYSDINSNYSRDLKTSDFKIDENNNAIKNSLRNILLTKKMERRMLPEFGSSLEQLLFEPIDNDTAKRIGSIILDEIDYWEPRINILNIEVIADEEKSSYEINIVYDIKTVEMSSDKISFVLGGT